MITLLKVTAVIANSLYVLVTYLNFSNFEFNKAFLVYAWVSAIGLFETLFLYVFGGLVAVNNSVNNRNYYTSRGNLFTAMMCVIYAVIVTAAIRSIDQSFYLLISGSIAASARCFVMIFENSLELRYAKLVHSQKVLAQIIACAAACLASFVVQSAVLVIIINISSYSIASFSLGIFRMKNSLCQESVALITPKASVKMGFRLLFSIISGYILSPVLITLCCDKTNPNYSQVALTISMSGTIVAVVLAEKNSRRLLRDDFDDNIFTDTLFQVRVFVENHKVTVGFMVSVSITAIYMALGNENFIKKAAKIPGYDIITQGVLITVINIIACAAAIDARRKMVEPVLFGNVIVIIISSLFYFNYFEPIRPQIFLLVYLCLNFLIMTEVIFSRARLYREI